MTKKFVTSSPDETISLGEQIGKLLVPGDVIAFKGGLGVGKTTITHGIATGIGLPDDVSSPTFALVNEYRGKVNLYHFDMYRIDGALDLESIGFYDYFDGDNILCIEWSENIENELPDNSIILQLKRIDENTREITLIGDERLDSLGN